MPAKPRNFTEEAQSRREIQNRYYANNREKVLARNARSREKRTGGEGRTDEELDRESMKWLQTIGGIHV